MRNDLALRLTLDAPGATFDASSNVVTTAVDQREDEPDRCEVELADPSGALADALTPGLSLELDVGAPEGPGPLFRGVVYRVESTFPAEGAARQRLVAYDRSLLMGLARRHRAFPATSLSDLARRVAGAGYAFRDVEVDLAHDPSFAPRGTRQSDETDLGFLRRLAREHGGALFVRADDGGDTLVLASRARLLEADPDVTLAYGRAGAAHPLLWFDATDDVNDRPRDRAFSGVDERTAEPLAVRVLSAEHEPLGSPPPFGDVRTDLRDPIRAGQIEALTSAAPTARARLAEATGGAERLASPSFGDDDELAKRAENCRPVAPLGQRGRGALAGDPWLRARRTVEIVGVGARLSGAWYVSEVRHTLDERGCRSEFSCLR